MIRFLERAALTIKLLWGAVKYFGNRLMGRHNNGD